MIINLGSSSVPNPRKIKIAIAVFTKFLSAYDSTISTDALFRAFIETSLFSEFAHWAKEKCGLTVRFVHFAGSGFVITALDITEDENLTNFLLQIPE